MYFGTPDYLERFFFKQKVNIRFYHVFVCTEIQCENS